MAEYDFQKDVKHLREMERRARRILDVSEDADLAEIRRMYWSQAMDCHPDRNPGDRDAERRFRLLTSAYEFLTKGKTHDSILEEDDPETGESPSRGKYDQTNSWGYYAWWRESFF